MKVYVALVVLAWAAYCHAADKNYGDFCAKADKCLGDTTCMRNSKCTYGTCTCKSGKIRNTGNTCKDYIQKKVGESCSANTECMGSYVTCTSSKCACNSGYVAADDKKTCGRYVGMDCTSATNCGSQMDCTSKKCACKSTHKEVSKMCVGFNLGESCSGGKACAYGTCTSNTCSCANNLVAYLSTLCINSGATKDLGEGSDCTTYTTAATGKFCKKGLSCTYCPNDTSKRLCLSGAPSMKAGLLTATVAAFLAFLSL